MIIDGIEGVPEQQRRQAAHAIASRRREDVLELEIGLSIRPFVAHVHVEEGACKITLLPVGSLPEGPVGQDLRRVIGAGAASEAVSVGEVVASGVYSGVAGEDVMEIRVGVAGVVGAERLGPDMLSVVRGALPMFPRRIGSTRMEPPPGPETPPAARHRRGRGGLCDP